MTKGHVYYFPGTNCSYDSFSYDSLYVCSDNWVTKPFSTAQHLNIESRRLNGILSMVNETEMQCARPIKTWSRERSSNEISARLNINNSIDFLARVELNKVLNKQVDEENKISESSLSNCRVGNVNREALTMTFQLINPLSMLMIFRTLSCLNLTVLSPEQTWTVNQTW